MTESARKTVLPRFILTQLTDEGDSAATQVDLKSGGYYFTRPVMMEGETIRRDGLPSWVPYQFNQYPVVLQGDGSLWPEANLWILHSLGGKPFPKMAGFHNIADDLCAFRRFIDEHKIDWLKFPAPKGLRPTYRFNGSLKVDVESNEIEWSTARRRMATVIRFYRWLVEEQKVLSPEFPMWAESDRYIDIPDRHGGNKTIQVQTTDVSIKQTKADDPYDGHIDDGGKLRPLPHNQQEWLLDALEACGNTEMSYIHLLALWTGGRIQTLLTFRVCHVLEDRRPNENGEVLIQAGPGTGIDTKYDKKLMLFIPSKLYEKLRVYALSERAKRRRLRAVGGNNPDQYLFLSSHGLPMYAAHGDHAFAKSKARRHIKTGQAVRQYMQDYIIPFIRKKYDSNFDYRFHDLRATFGMNLVDIREPLMNDGKLSYTDVLGFVQARMNHESPATTERYLRYRKRMKVVRAAQDDWESKLKRMIDLALVATDA